MNFLEAAKKLVEIDSSPSNGTGEAGAFIEVLAKGLGFQVRLENEIQKGTNEANVVCFPHQSDRRVHLILQTHLDTYDPGSFALWEKTGRNPFYATIHEGYLHGLGVADTKLDFLCKLYAAKSFLERKPNKNFAVVGTYGEEYNMNGAVRLIRHTLQADRILVSEPTSFDLVTSGKGMANIEITISFSPEEMQARAEHDQNLGQSAQCKVFRGRPAHSSQPLQGENAIEKMFSYLQQLPSQMLILEVDGGTNYNSIPVQSLVEFDLVPVPGSTVNTKILQIYEKVLELKKAFDDLPDQAFNPPVATLNIGMIRTYSDHLKIMGCVRWPPKVTEEVYLDWMDQLKEQCSAVGAVFRVRDYKKPFAVDRQSEFVKLCHQAIQAEAPQSSLATQPVTNEANVFHKLGLETLVFGPGDREGNSQTPNESIAIENLHKATKVYQNIIERICY
jgi:succinyl-diaminopimelate desuccinylase